MSRRRLPIGIQTFRKIRESGAYYVDKTPWIEQLVDEGQHYFLSRPRRFGKSLLLDTMKELFEGNKELFEGLAIHDRWDWSVKRPVVRLDFGTGPFGGPGDLAKRTAKLLDRAERNTGIQVGGDDAPDRLFRILETLHERSGHRVALLVDEYDKPILDALAPADAEDERPDLARANREFLAGLYSVVKGADAHLRFSLLTGVTRAVWGGLTSGLNNLYNITLDQRYGGICGFTQEDLDTVFAPEMAELDRERVREWYGGYSWGGDERVYNPFGVLRLFDTGEFAPHWFESGSPRFLIERLLRGRVATPELNEMEASADLLSAFDIEEISTEALLFQTGYLTIEKKVRVGSWTRYRLRYPNLEVRQALNQRLLRRLDPDRKRVEAASSGCSKPGTRPG